MKRFQLKRQLTLDANKFTNLKSAPYGEGSNKTLSKMGLSDNLETIEEVPYALTM